MAYSIGPSEPEKRKVRDMKPRIFFNGGNLPRSHTVRNLVWALYLRAYGSLETGDRDHYHHLAARTFCRAKANREDWEKALAWVSVHGGGAILKVGRGNSGRIHRLVWTEAVCTLKDDYGARP